jgi:molecular chaperone HscB
MFDRCDYFELFGVNPAFSQDLDQLKQRYFELQKKVHPDYFAGGSESDRAASLRQASYVNTAYDTLKDPVLRASYLLSLAGVSLDIEINTAMSHDFLLKQMHWRESMEAISEKADGANGGDAAFSAFLALKAEIEQETQERTQQIAALFAASFSLTAVDASVVGKISNLVRELVFLKKLKEECVVLADQFD